MDWAREENWARSLSSKVIGMRLLEESERVLIADVLARKVWFPLGGIYFLRDGERIVYIGLTGGPIRQRLYLAIANKKTWTRADYSGWTVTMQRAPEYPADLDLERRLIHEHNPPYNVRGRPKKATGDDDGLQPIP